MEKKSRYNSIYEIVKRIPAGKVATYGQIARLAGLSGHARQVGYALHNLPSGSDVPWQRVINRHGKISFDTDTIVWNMQKSLLEAEGVVFDENCTISLSEYQWKV
jgi:methylated-DNA-protein-cysteine methyltransferase-like protein